MIKNINIFKKPILEIINNYVFLTKKGSNNYFGICPFHVEKTPSFSVNSKENYFYCFGCHESGDVIDFLKKIKGINFFEAINFIKNKKFNLELNLEKKKYIFNNSEKEEFFNLNNNIKNFFKKKLKHSKKAINYLFNRGYNEKIIKKFCLGYSSYKSSIKFILNNYSKNIVNCVKITKKKDNFSFLPERIIIPIIDINLKVLGFSGRNIFDKKPKYLNSPKSYFFVKNKNFYGIWLTNKFIKKKNFVIIVEGYFDVLTLFQNNLKNVLGLMGSNFSYYHLKIVLNLSENIFFCLDSDLAGFLSVKKILKLFIVNNFIKKNIRFIYLPKNYDPDSFIKKFGYKNFLIKLKVSYSLQKTFYNVYIKNIFDDKKNIKKNLLELKFILREINKINDKLLIFYLISNNKNFNIKHFFFLIEFNNKKEYKFYDFSNICFENKTLFFLLIYPEIFFYIKNILSKYIFLLKKKNIFQDLISLIKKLNDINFIELFLLAVNSKYYFFYKKLIIKNLNIELWKLVKFNHDNLEKKKFKKKFLDFIFFFKKKIKYIIYIYEKK